VCYLLRKKALDPIQFDGWTRALATSRRALVGMAIAGLAAHETRRRQATATAGRATTASRKPVARAADDATATPVAPRNVCANANVGDLADRKVGELLDFEEITALDDPNFPSNARAWRILYVSTTIDNLPKAAICGIVVAPAAAENIALHHEGDQVSARSIAWCHGTLGMTLRCQPSSQPEAEIWGATPYGINVLSWGSEDAGDLHTGSPENGILAGLIDAGWVVVASDYLTGLGGSDTLEPYASGKVEAANTIDNLRAAHQLLQQVYPGYAPAAYDVIPWGHSQGGHAALWTGQLLDAYTAATANPGEPALRLSGVAAEAPGSNFIVQPDKQPDAAPATGMLDWLANAQMTLTGVSTPIPVAPFFLSYLVGTWAQFSASGTPAPDQMPAFPPDLGELDMTAIVMPDALQTVADVSDICWADGEKVVEYTSPYLTTPFLQPAISDGPVMGDLQHGNLGITCAGDPDPEQAKWCAWLRYNLPGPLGEHAMAKLPRRGDALVPVLLTQGSGDTVVHCVATEGTENDLPSASDCMSVALYEAMQAEYCPESGEHGMLSLRIWRPQAGVTDGSHSAITALPGTSSLTDPAFTGSMLQQFFQDAFDGKLTPGCSAEVVNKA
jgi:hypothetical protein